MALEVLIEDLAKLPKLGGLRLSFFPEIALRFQLQQCKMFRVDGDKRMLQILQLTEQFPIIVVPDTPLCIGKEMCDDLLQVPVDVPAHSELSCVLWEVPFIC